MRKQRTLLIVLVCTPSTHCEGKERTLPGQAHYL